MQEASEAKIRKKKVEVSVAYKELKDLELPFKIEYLPITYPKPNTLRLNIEKLSEKE